MTLDYEASAARLAEWLATMRAAEWTPTESVKKHRDLAKQIEDVAELLNGQQWLFLAHEVDKDPPPETGIDGFPIVIGETNAGRYQGTIDRLREIAEAANRMADEYPNSRAKPELMQAAECFLHIWYQSEKDRPAIYDASEAVTAFKSVLDTGGYPRSHERVRGIVGEALKNFDPLSWPPGFDERRFLVWRQ